MLFFALKYGDRVTRIRRETSGRTRPACAHPVSLAALLVLAAACSRTAALPDARPASRSMVIAEAEADHRDPLRVLPVRAWSHPTLSGTWCRLPLDTVVSILDERPGPPTVYLVVDPTGRCRGWLPSGSLAPAEEEKPVSPVSLSAPAGGDTAGPASVGVCAIRVAFRTPDVGPRGMSTSLSCRRPWSRHCGRWRPARRVPSCMCPRKTVTSDAGARRRDEVVTLPPAAA